MNILSTIETIVLVETLWKLRQLEIKLEKELESDEKTAAEIREAKKTPTQGDDA